MSFSRISQDLIATDNARHSDFLRDEYAFLGRTLGRRGIDIDAVADKARAFQLGIPSWGVGTGGTRFARFPLAGEPRSIWEKLEDCSVVHDLCRLTPSVSTHFPWDSVEDFSALRAHAQALDLNFGPVNSNTFQDQPGQAHSYKFGSLTHVAAAVREQAVAHNIECIRAGQALGAKALTVWIGDGANFPGQQDFAASFERYLASMAQIYAALPDNWHLFIEHKLYEPAFYATVIQDWGTSYIAANHLGSRARCLVDLGHHAPTVNIEMIVARLASFGRLGGFHFNDSKYGDDDLDSGSIDPFRLFLVFNELVEADRRGIDFGSLAHMLDQSHNVTDPIESLLVSAEAVAGAYVRALLVDREALRAAQEANDVMTARKCLKDAFECQVAPILGMVRAQLGGAINPLQVYRASAYRQARAADRPTSGGRSAGIV